MHKLIRLFDCFVVNSCMLKGAYYEQEYWKREWSYVFLTPLFSTLFAVLFLILFYHTFAHLLGIHTPVRFLSFAEYP